MALWRKYRDRLLTKLWWMQFEDFRHSSRIRQIMSLTTEEKRARRIERTVRMSANYPGMWSRIINLTPRGECQWGKTLFVADGEGDLYFVINSFMQRQPGSDYLPVVDLPDRSRVWALHMEPEDYVKKLGYDNPVEHQRFSRFYTTCESLLASGGIYHSAPPYVTFHLSRTWDFLNAASPMRKTIPLGLIMSGLKNIEGHNARFEFLEVLAASTLDYAFWGRGAHLDRYRGYRGFAGNKWSAHAACQYSIVLENSVAPYYWSEKPADSLLAWSFPIYYGCPNLSQFLPEKSFAPIDIRNPREAVGRIVALTRECSYQERLPALFEARQRLLHEQHLFAFIDREIDAHF